MSNDNDNLIEKEAEEEEEEESRDSDEEEEGPEIDEYEKDGFVVDDIDEEPEPSEEGATTNNKESIEKKRKKKKAQRSLDEDDLELIHEASGVSLRRSDDYKKTFKRIKQSRSEPSERSEFDELFGSDQERDAGPVEHFDEQPEDEEELFDEDEDDLDRFIVDLDEHGRPIKRKKRGALSRATSSQMSEARSIFETSEFDFDESAEGQERVPPKLIDIYEPQELQEKFFTAEDREIQLTDIPEREQLRFKNREAPTDDELKEEAEWIFSSVFKPLDTDMQVQVVVPKIIYVLGFLRKEHLEVPFIFTYRKDYYAPDLKLSDLWDIYDWDEKWAHLQARKVTLRNIYDQANVTQELHSLLDRSQNETEVQDLLDHFQMYYAGEIKQEAKHKRASKRDFYRIIKKTRVLEFIKLFGLTAEQFGENTLKGYMVHEPVNPEQDPEVLATDYRCPEFPSVEVVLKAAHAAIAQQIAYDPLVRQSVRGAYEGAVQLSTQATVKGKKECDAFHPYIGVLYIDHKPLQAFKSVQYLEILKAEKEGFITVKIEVPESFQENELLKELEALYLSEGQSGLAQRWNEHRKQILRLALTQHLYPILEKEMRAKLMEEARERVAVKCSEKLHQKIIAGPYNPPPEDNIDEIRVMACQVGELNEPIMCAILGPDGELVAQLKLNHLLGHQSDPRRAEDQKKATEFITENLPAVIAIGSRLEARPFYDEMVSIVSALFEKKDIEYKPHVTYVDLEVPRIFAVSPRADSEFPEYPTNLRESISIGRLLLDPLTEIAALCNNSQEVTCIKLHSLQSMVSREYLVKILERCFINVVNRVGVDINRAVLHKHASGTLQFVSGLGPRKAVHIMSAIYRKGGKISSRAELDMVGTVVFANCAGFIRILDKYVTESEFDVLDNTRVHPEDYNLVRKMAADALERYPTEELVDKLMQKPKKLEDIDLDAFADELERNGKQKKKSTLHDIKQEMYSPFADPRPEYRDPDPDEVFTMLTGETDATLRIGQQVNARIVAITPRAVKCKMENGLAAVIEVSDLSDKQVSKPSELAIEIGMVLACRIKSISKDECVVRLTSKSSELQSTEYARIAFEELTIQEPYLKFPQEERPDVAPKIIQKKKKPRAKIVTRRIDHPLFKNVTFSEAEEYLRTKEPGEIVIRPSSRGTSYLTITWKFYEDSFVHINVEERDKTNPHLLGKSLYINNEKYEDLDEIMARYIEPMNSFCQEMQKFRHFKGDSSQSQIDQLLKERKTREPQTIPYFVNIAPDAPGKFVLSYLPVNRVKHEFINVTPDGFTFRRQRFHNPDKLVKWFKIHWREPAPQRTPPRTKSNEPPVYPQDFGEEPAQPPKDYDPQRFSEAMALPYNPPVSSAYADMDYVSTAQQAWTTQPQVPLPSPHHRPPPRGNDRPHRGGGGRGRGGGGRGGGRPRGGGAPRTPGSAPPSNSGWASGGWASTEASGWGTDNNQSGWGTDNNQSGWANAANNQQTNSDWGTNTPSGWGNDNNQSSSGWGK